VGAPSSSAEIDSAGTLATASRPLLTVVVPVYNGGDRIVENVELIRDVVARGVGEGELEVIVVSDGSIDGTAERLLEARAEAGIRVIHYDRNLGKGYAVKTGALAGHGDWVALVDADLDLDPGAIPGYLDVARSERLDFAIGSKRHPESVVHYPRSRRVASWCYQLLNRVLFRLDVRDTQVGLKVFRREVVDEVVPLLLVKQFAFDLDLLAVARALGFGRVRELPVRLDYRFTGSGVRSRAVARALVDTAAIFYRLRILHTYQRKRALLGRRPTGAREEPLVSVLGDEDAAARLDYPQLELVPLRSARGSVLAVLAPGAVPGGNWVTAAVPYFADPEVAAVVVPTVAPPGISGRELLAAAVLESRLGGGSRRPRYLPGNVRVVSDYPARAVVVRREDYLPALDEGVDGEALVAWLAERGRTTVYTPDASVSERPPPLVRPHLRATFRHARARGAAARHTRGNSLSRATALSFAFPVLALLALAAVVLGGASRSVGLVVLLAYGAVLLASGVFAGLRFRSPVVGVLEPLAVLATQAAYVGGFVAGLAGGRKPSAERQA